MSKQNYLIIGAGRSGIAAAKLLEGIGETYAIYDGKTDLDTAAVLEAIETKDDIKFILGDVTTEELKGNYDVCIVSPGVPLFAPVMKAVVEAGIPVWSEIELAYLHDKGTVLAITGTNGITNL